jgi:hypothetical protein
MEAARLSTLKQSSCQWPQHGRFTVSLFKIENSSGVCVLECSRDITPEIPDHKDEVVYVRLPLILPPETVEAKTLLTTQRFVWESKTPVKSLHCIERFFVKGNKCVATFEFEHGACEPCKFYDWKRTYDWSRLTEEDRKLLASGEPMDLNCSLFADGILIQFDHVRYLFTKSTSK